MSNTLLELLYYLNEQQTGGATVVEQTRLMLACLSRQSSKFDWWLPAKFKSVKLRTVGWVCTSDREYNSSIKRWWLFYVQYEVFHATSIRSYLSSRLGMKHNFVSVRLLYSIEQVDGRVNRIGLFVFNVSRWTSWRINTGHRDMMT